MRLMYSKLSYFHSKGILKLKIKSQKKINFKFILKKLDIRWFSGIEILFLQSAKKKKSNNKHHSVKDWTAQYYIDIAELPF